MSLSAMIPPLCWAWTGVCAGRTPRLLFSACGTEVPLTNLSRVKWIYFFIVAHYGALCGYRFGAVRSGQRHLTARRFFAL